ncbi:sigma-70 family RNA polymerase sigma factor [Candidatus Parcubacteria bacterium]|uniref:RNA polymerase subunit sigma-24 n=1 Tax=Candidatus Kaiserbacteria bacterium CG10_big_fil_rev_8_21_14_0_10_47_16 TaxID=1974608 RepID=A0A2H0UDL4_9BACT|nr:sigma-70 family RNA polymerase sigma factor [Candidatus Parcubacteria bacterium]PIR84514.1 MAG: hypothetical protein COU16_02975 [Candidatus Kaiserbacteria bacterium CG10_big_fil_rev_8_21_14_0_10_47_16]
MPVGGIKTDEELVEMARNQREFFGLLIERYEAKLARYVRRLGVRDEEDVADVLQEIFIKAYRNLNEFDTALSFSSWMYRIAHNEAINSFRKKRVRPEGHLVSDSEDILTFVASTEKGSEILFDAALDAAVVGRAVSHLDNKYRDVVILRFFEHKEYDEISDILKIPIGSVATLLHRAKGRLRKELKEHPAYE